VVAVSAAEACARKAEKRSDQNSTSAHSALVFIGVWLSQRVRRCW